MEYFNATEARKKTNDIISNKINEERSKIFMNINESIQKGKDSCFFNLQTPNDIIVCWLRELGYNVNYGKEFDRNEAYEDKSKLIISW